MIGDLSMEVKCHNNKLCTMTLQSDLPNAFQSTLTVLNIRSSHSALSIRGFSVEVHDCRESCRYDNVEFHCPQDNTRCCNNHFRLGRLAAA